MNRDLNLSFSSDTCTWDLVRCLCSSVRVRDNDIGVLFMAETQTVRKLFFAGRVSLSLVLPEFSCMFVTSRGDCTTAKCLAGKDVYIRWKKR